MESVKLGEVNGETPAFSGDRVEEGKTYRAVNSQGTSDLFESEMVFAGHLVGECLIIWLIINDFTLVEQLRTCMSACLTITNP